MKSRAILSAILAGLLALSAASAALAADQEVEVRVWPAGMSIEVQDHLNLGDVAPGLSTNAHEFGMDVFNMTGNAWQITVDADDLEAGWWRCEEDIDGHCIEDSDYWDPLVPAVTLDAANLKVTGGDINVDEYDQLTTSPITSTGTETSAKGGSALMAGDFNEHHYHLHINDPHSTMRFDLTGVASVEEAHYRTTVVYTIMDQPAP